MAVNYLKTTGTLVTLTIAGDDVEHFDDFDPWGTEDVDTAVENMRIQVDSMISVGEKYLLGDGLCVCVEGPQRDLGTRHH